MADEGPEGLQDQEPVERRGITIEDLNRAAQARARELGHEEVLVFTARSIETGPDAKPLPAGYERATVEITRTPLAKIGETTKPQVAVNRQPAAKRSRPRGSRRRGTSPGHRSRRAQANAPPAAGDDSDEPEPHQGPRHRSCAPGGRA